LVLIERARLEEFTGNMNEARKYLDVSMLLSSPSERMNMNATTKYEKSKKNKKSRVDGRWRLVHYSALLELRAGNLSHATETVRGVRAWCSSVVFENFKKILFVSIFL
jgi:hypothetical protein